MPEVTNTTSELEASVIAYIFKVQELNDAWHWKRFSDPEIPEEARLNPPQITADRLRKWFRVVQVFADKHRVAHSFVNMETGDIYAAATWKAPYINGPNPVRGSVFRLDEGGFDAMGASRQGGRDKTRQRD